MTYQDFLIDETKHAFREAFKDAGRVPADKLDWKPLDSGRSVLDQARELAKCPDWAIELCTNGPEGDHSEEAMAASKAEMAAWATVAECEKVYEEKAVRLYEMIRSFPTDRLEETMMLPYDGGREFTYKEMLGYPMWNAMYHQGQINYIQTLYGDFGM